MIYFCTSDDCTQQAEKEKADCHMNTMKHIIPILILTLIVHAADTAALTRNGFKTINGHDGLPSNWVADMAQDKNGYLWLATSGALCRYDGVSFITYRHRHGDDTSIQSNFVTKIATTDDGVYAGTDTGLSFLSFADGKFHRCMTTDGKSTEKTYRHVTAIACAGGATLFTDMEGGLYASTPDDRLTFRRVAHRFSTYGICACGEDRLLAVNNRHIYLLTADGRKVLAHSTLTPGSANKVNISYIAQTGTAYVGNGLGHDSEAFSVRGNTLRRSDTYTPQNLMEAVWHDGKTVFATDGYGIIVTGDGVTERYNTANSNISGDVVYTLLSDRTGGLWAGTYRAGLNCNADKDSDFTVLDKASGNLTFNIVTAVVPTKDKIYVGLDGGGLTIYDRNPGRTAAFNSHNSGIPGDTVVPMTSDGTSLWMAVYTKGLVQYTPSTGKFTLLPMPSSKDNADYNNVWCLLDDGEGNIWVGGSQLYIYNKVSHRFSPGPITGNVTCSSICSDGRHIWLSSNASGIYKIDKRRRKVVAHYTSKEGNGPRLPSNKIKYVHADAHGTVWFTAENIGFYSLDTATGDVKPHDIAEGLTSQQVMSITEDGTGRLWIGTDGGGMFSYDRTERMFRSYAGNDDIPHTFTYSAAATHDGAVYMGTLDGLLCFKPAELGHPAASYAVNFNDLTLMDKSRSVFNLYGGTGDISLAYNQNFFTVSFSVPELHTPGSRRFSCRLDGLEDEWRYLGDMRNVSYTNVPPGRYKLYVRSTDADGRWGKASVLYITVTPPWWKTTWATLLWTILAAIAVYAGISVWMNQQKAKQRIRISEIEKDATKKLSEAKLNFYANITHELRTPVFLIMAQLEDLISARTSVVSVPSSYLQMMHRCAIKLNKLITRVIDFRKMDSGKLKLSLRQGDIIDFCNNMVDDYVEMCRQKEITFDFKHKDNEIKACFDPEKLDIILSNLISNAYKYTREGGHVTLTVEDGTDKVTFSVEDNGIGILKEMQENIFKDFFRTERGMRQSGGDGMGLAFVKQLVELYGGEIHVESEPEHGSTFIFYIPKRHAGQDETAEDIQQANAVETMETYTKNDNSTLPATSKAANGQGAIDNPTAVHSILIIDDERETVNLLERNLAPDFKIYKAYNGVEGLDMARKHLPDIILCDLMMPQMDGMQMLEELKKDKKLQTIKVAIFTAKSSEDDMIKAFDNGADAYVTKPISLKYLRTRIDRLIAQSDNAAITGELTAEKKSYNKEEQIFLLRCREVIDANLANEDFNMDYLADKLAMSHSALYKKVKTITGMSLIEFVNEYKVYKAVQMFKRGATNIENVANQCGFNDIKTFREAFKRKMKMTPKQYVQGL